MRWRFQKRLAALLAPCCYAFDVECAGEPERDAAFGLGFNEIGCSVDAYQRNDEQR